MTFYSILTSYLLCSYAIGWCINGIRAIHTRMIDLCQFVQSFIIAPVLLGLLLIILLVIWIAIIPNIGNILIFLASIIGSMVMLWAAGRFVVKPTVKKAFGVAKPFSDKICVVMYKR